MSITPRAKRAQRVVRKHSHSTAQVECLHCESTQIVDCDEDGSAAIEQWPCQGSDDCTAMLCDDCPQFQCECCGLYSCIEHTNIVQGETVCAICAKEILSEDVPTLVTESVVA